MFVTYPAIFYKDIDSKGYVVVFPDFEEGATQGEDENTGGNTSNNNQSNNNLSGTNSSSKPPKTGDNGILGYLIFIISCFVVLKVVNRKGSKA